MKSRATRTLVLALAAMLTVVLPGTASAAEAKPPAEVRIEDLSWLAGHWSGEVKGAGPTTRFETYYTTPEGGAILSVSKAFADGKISWFELERFAVQDGVIKVTPHPGGKASDPFALVEYDPATRTATFTNPEHDYPKRITYRLLSPDRLHILLTGHSSAAPVMEFTLSRLP